MKKLIAGALALMMAFSAFGVTNTYYDTTVPGTTEQCDASNGDLYYTDVTRTYKVTTEVVDGDTITTTTEISNVDSKRVDGTSGIATNDVADNFGNTSVVTADSRIIYHTWTVTKTEYYTDGACSNVLTGNVYTENFVVTETAPLHGDAVTIVGTINLAGEIQDVTRTFISETTEILCGDWIPSEEREIPETGPYNPEYEIVWERTCTETTTYAYEITRS